MARKKKMKGKKPPSKYNGVTWYRALKGSGLKNRWRSELTYLGVKHIIGIFDDELDAAREYDKLARSIIPNMNSNRKFTLNFPTPLEKLIANRYLIELENENKKKLAAEMKLAAEKSAERKKKLMEKKQMLAAEKKKKLMEKKKKLAPIKSVNKPLNRLMDVSVLKKFRIVKHQMDIPVHSCLFGEIDNYLTKDPINIWKDQIPVYGVESMDIGTDYNLSVKDPMDIWSDESESLPIQESINYVENNKILDTIMETNDESCRLNMIP